MIKSSQIAREKLDSYCKNAYLHFVIIHAQIKLHVQFNIIIVLPFALNDC